MGIGLLLTILIPLCSGNLAALMNAPSEAFEQTSRYIAICGAFSSDADVVAAGFDYLKAYGIDCLLTCFLFCFIGFYNGLGRTGFVMLQGIAAAFMIRIPVAYLMCRMTGRLFYIGLGIPCSTVFQIILCFFYFGRIRRPVR